MPVQMNLRGEKLCLKWKCLCCIFVLFPSFGAIACSRCIKNDAWQLVLNNIKDKDEQMSRIASSIYENDDIMSCAKPPPGQFGHHASGGSSRCLRRKCRHETFILPGMNACHQWLNCTNIANEVDIIREIGGGAVKKVFLGTWRQANNPVVVSKPVTMNSVPLYENDFENGLNFLTEHSPSDCLIQLVGFCRNPLTIVTEYHRTGSVARFARLVESKSYQKLRTLKARFQLCLDYVEILAWLHSDDIGTRVMCDSNDLQKTLEQYLLLDSLRLILNDVDALPSVKKHSKRQSVKCGHRPLHGDFVAPEQRWPYPRSQFDDNRMPSYDEKTDVWKIPDVCQYFIEGSQDEAIILYHLFAVHKQCKSENPKDRPTAHQVLLKYQDVWETLGLLQ